MRGDNIMRLSTILPAITVLLAASVPTAAAPPATDQSASAPVAVAQPAASQPLDGKLARESEARLRKLLLDRPVTARVAFPATESGIELFIDGRWDTKRVQESIADHGIGVEQAATASITDVKVKSKHIEIHLDGGGGVQKLATASVAHDKKTKTDKARRGSRINLRFERELTTDDVQGLDQLLSYLEPLVDPSLIRQEVKHEPIPSESAAGVKRGPIVRGMNVNDVVAALGLARYKHVDTRAGLPIEKWHYDLPGSKTRVITFQSGKVLMVEEF
jgi:hypothetical protein